MAAHACASEAQLSSEGAPIKCICKIISHRRGLELMRSQREVGGRSRSEYSVTIARETSFGVDSIGFALNVINLKNCDRII